MNTFSELFLVGVILAAVQVLAAVPWLTVAGMSWARLLKRKVDAGFFLKGVAGLAVATLVLGAFLASYMQRTGDKDAQSFNGGVYGLILHVQLNVDLFVGVFAALLLAWPKGAAVALAAFRESWRQPMFWLILVIF